MFLLRIADWVDYTDKQRGYDLRDNTEVSQIERLRPQRKHRGQSNREATTSGKMQRSVDQRGYDQATREKIQWSVKQRGYDLRYDREVRMIQRSAK